MSIQTPVKYVAIVEKSMNSNDRDIHIYIYVYNFQRMRKREGKIERHGKNRGTSGSIEK